MDQKNACEELENKVKELEKEFNVQLDRFRIAQDISLDAFTILRSIRNSKGKIIDFEWTYANSAAGKILKQSPEKLIGQRLLEILPGNCKNFSLFERYVGIVETGQGNEVELRYQSEGIDGWFRNMTVKLDDGVAVSFIDITKRKKAEEVLQQHKEDLERLVSQRTAELQQEITERKRAEESLRKSEEQYRFLLNNTSDFIARFDLNGILVFGTDASFRFHGYETNEIINTSGFDRVHPKDHDKLRDKLKHIIETGTEQLAEYRIMRKNGEYMWVEATGRLVSNATGEPEIIVVQRDITERKQAEEKQKQLESQLRHSQKMEAIGQLVGGIAHNFNNILQVILGYSEIIMYKYPALDPLQEDIYHLIKASQKASDIVHQLLLFSRRETMRPQKFCLNGIINELVKMIKPIIGEQIQIHLNLCPNLKDINADRGQIEQVIMNLCINARDAMQKGGNITIETLNTVITPEFCKQGYSFAEEGEYILLSIADTGHGIPPEMHEHIFEPFFTTKKIGKGTGLGLATCYGIIKSHQGFTFFDSAIGKGTIFKIYLPIAKANISSVKSESIQLTPAISKKETILYAEDEEEVRNMLSRIMKNAGYKVIEASNGKEAIRYFQEHQEEIQLAILDIVMPECSGEQVLEKIKQLSPDMPVLFCSGYSEELLDVNIFKDSRYKIIYKPILSKVLLTKIRTMLDMI